MRPARVIVPVILLFSLLQPVLADGADEAEALGSGGPVVAILDSGIHAGHAEFSPDQVVAWKDYVNEEATPYDDSGHGTAVASRAVGLTLGAYPGGSLAVAKVLNASNVLPSWNFLALAIRWAADDAGADVVVISIWNGPLCEGIGTGACVPASPNPLANLAVAAAIDHAHARGVVVVTIAGNGGTMKWQGISVPYAGPASANAPASSAKAIVVGAADGDGHRAEFSQLVPDLLARGTNVAITSFNGNGYTSGSGTSYAAPWIGGAAARLLADGAPRDPDWLKWVLLHSAKPASGRTYAEQGYGFFGSSAASAARAVAQGEAPVPPLDERDVFHAISSGSRLVLSGATPAGWLPP